MKIGAKIALGFFVVILIMAVSAGISYYLMERIQEQSENLQTHEVVLATQSNRLAYNSALKTAALRGYMMNRQSGYLEEYNRLNQEDDKLLQELETKAINNTDKELVREIKKLDLAYRKLFQERAMPLIQSGDGAALAELMKNEAVPAAAAWRSKIEESMKFRDNQIYQGFEAEQGYAEHAQTLVLTGLALALAVGIAIAWQINRVVARPLVLATGYMDRLAERDFSVEISEASLRRTDEIGSLARSMHTMIVNMREILQTLARSAEQLASSSEELTASAAQSADGAASVAASTDTVSAGLQTVSASTEQITASAENVGANLSQIADNAANGNQTARTVEQQAVSLQTNAQSSRRSAVDLYEGISERVVLAIADARIVEEISSMAASIATIAGQTNLLALNAAIEAARAGEQGRGFAVVAEEVRKLAEESSRSVDGIQELTKRVQAAISLLVDNSNELLQFLNGTVRSDYDAFVNVGEQYKKDAEDFQRITGDIGDKLQQVTGEMSEINRAIESVAATMEESAGSTQLIAKGTGEVSQSLQEITRASGVLAESAAEINQLLVKFKI
ncbi:MAG TPA: methyl-accepting chemotaxis protein [Patescibacteria group bacterium]|nr:methyl-accepting chemotaxis protein [Patescibacteria group bacterium]